MNTLDEAEGRENWIFFQIRIKYLFANTLYETEGSVHNVIEMLYTRPKVEYISNCK